MKIICKLERSSSKQLLAHACFPAIISRHVERIIHSNDTNAILIDSFIMLSDSELCSYRLISD